MTDQTPPLPEIDQPNRSALRNLSVVWLVPVLALAVALGIAWQAYSDRGTLIEIRFENGAGVTAGETTVRYRDVVIGTVEDVRFSPDLQTVIVEARVENEVLPFLDEDATFWVVRPEISTQGVSGLSTVVSGVFIEGAWDSRPEIATRSFDGRESPLFVLPGDEGRRITLNVSPGIQLQGGAPVTFRGIQVGRLEQPDLTEDGLSITVDAFIDAPHDQRITQATRFWDSSGFSVSFGADGLTLDVESLASLVTGGIEFDEVYSNGQPVEGDAVFEVYESEEAARASAFDVASIGEVPVAVEFSNYIRGLVPGTQVVMANDQIGEVTAVTVQSVEIADGSKQRLVVDLVLDPGRMGFPVGTGAEEVYEYLAEQVADGLRARLATAGLISSETRIEFAIDYDARPARFEVAADPYPVMPSVMVEQTNVNTTAEGVLERVAALPFEELLSQAIDTLASIEGLAGDPALRDVPEEVVALLTEARELVGGDETQAIPGEARAAVAELRGILAELREAGTIAALTSVIAQADEAMGPITEASAVLPEVMANLRALSETAAELEIEALITTANTVLASADAFISSEGMAEVPANLSASLVELEALVAELRAADVVGSLNTTLASTSAAAEELPALVERTDAVLTRINTLVGAYGARSAFMGETMDVLREITTAARSIAQLARAIERNPSSLITGR
ncbi:MlaD family protein [Boseongicola sp. H5]|uniref:PqiB family protein n=1 Tax=Boseongicola sp. H5 TaxID=2763261 RepID=UPI001D0A446F|nr:MlaD family protein [Boseongicola sp. H5]